MTKEKRVLRADVYDALELSALAFGGIGWNVYFEPAPLFGDRIPCCAIGHALCLNGEEVRVPEDSYPTAYWALRNAGITVGVNDVAVRAILARNHASDINRVSFAQWCEELNVTREN